ncbi:MAG: MJ0042-type zinc finger domain-containing protein, partial [Moraxellaceae bacterium]
MTAKKTQCPFCESIFAVTPEQLSARGGHVRCGKCFQVFKADEHLVLPTPLGVSSAAVPETAVAADIFDLLDQPSSHNDESDTLAGQPVLVPAAPTQHQANNTKASELGKLEQKTDLEVDFDALFSSLAPQSIDPNESYAQSAQSKHTGSGPAQEPSNRLLTP